MLAAWFALEGQFAPSAPPTHHPLRACLVFSFLPAADEAYLLSQESVRAPNIMNDESTPVRVRALRVIQRQGGVYSRSIVLEDVERGQFGVVNYISYENGPTKTMKARRDRDDTWNVLDSLRNTSRFRENAGIHWAVADSIDAAISQDEIRRNEFWDRALHGKTPSRAPEEHQPTNQQSKPAIMATRGSGPSEEELQKMIKEVWDFAGRKRLKWKPIGRTPAGRKCEVLTFDGSEEVLVGPKSLEVRTKSN